MGEPSGLELAVHPITRNVLARISKTDLGFYLVMRAKMFQLIIGEPVPWTIGWWICGQAERVEAGGGWWRWWAREEGGWSRSGSSPPLSGLMAANPGVRLLHPDWLLFLSLDSCPLFFFLIAAATGQQ